MIKFVVVLLAFCLLVSIKANPLHDELIEGGGKTLLFFSLERNLFLIVNNLRLHMKPI